LYFASGHERRLDRVSWAAPAHRRILEPLTVLAAENMDRNESWRLAQDLYSEV